MTDTPIVILGTGGNCLDILDMLRALNRPCAGFLDDDPDLWNQSIDGLHVLGPLSMAAELGDCSLVNGIGSPASFRDKEAIIRSCGLPAERFTTVVHPTASVSPTAVLGRGTVLMAHVTVGSHARLGDHVMVLSNSVVNHDAAIGDYSCLASGVSVSGRVVVGRSCYLGTNSSMIGDVSIGDGAMIGMGSVVLDDVAAQTVVAGNPAKRLHQSVAV
ncbi:MAG TPA: NeuD/PglB/VioB family sugar acetyltransferase [Phycisphaerae bacterium]|jgi:sugar O-acyltransferase (sialic acid O-acetyltransferase NeuD family)